MTNPPDDGPVLAKVSTIQDAVTAIENLRAGKKISTCS